MATEENIKKAQEYVDEVVANEGFPTIEQLAFVLGIARSSLYTRKEFSNILEQIMQIQGHLLIMRGLQGDYNATIVKMMLSSKHGYVEQTAQDITTNGKDLPVTALVRFIDASNQTNN